MNRHYKCPVVHFTGAVGGLMAPPSRIADPDTGDVHPDGTFEFASAYGKHVAQMARQAIDHSQPIATTPMDAVSRHILVPLTNPLYLTARRLRVIQRDAFEWRGDPTGDRHAWQPDRAAAIETEVVCIRLGDLFIVGVPGELYPELIDGRFQNPVEPNVDFPDAPLEPTLTSMIRGNRSRMMILGLANDEIGYIMPKRQWDLAAPFAYGRSSAQYGEVNSVGPDAAPVVMTALRDVVDATRAARAVPSH